MKINYVPKGVCSTKIIIDIENDRINDIKVINGCAGNSLGIKALLIGMKVEEAISKLDGIRCRAKSTSCPDQIAQALKTL